MTNEYSDKGYQYLKIPKSRKIQPWTISFNTNLGFSDCHMCKKLCCLYKLHLTKKEGVYDNGVLYNNTLLLYKNDILLVSVVENKNPEFYFTKTSDDSLTKNILNDIFTLSNSELLKFCEVHDITIHDGDYNAHA